MKLNDTVSGRVQMDLEHMNRKSLNALEDEKRTQHSHNMRSWGFQIGVRCFTKELEKKMMDLISQCLDKKVLASWRVQTQIHHGPVKASTNRVHIF